MAGYLTKEKALEKIVAPVHGKKGCFSPRAVIQARKEKEHVYNLTPKEKEMLCARTDGFTNKQIAVQLAISQRTVRFHLSNLYDKLGVNSRVKAIASALKCNFV